MNWQFPKSFKNAIFKEAHERWQHSLINHSNLKIKTKMKFYFSVILAKKKELKLSISKGLNVLKHNV